MTEYTAQILNAQQGDRVAFGFLYDQHAKEIYRFAFSRTRNRDLAQDITSITFIKALEHIHRFSPKRSASFRAWLFTIAHRALIDTLRKRHLRDSALDYIPEPAQENTLEHDTEQLLYARHILNACKHLTSFQQQVIQLRIWDELSMKEIAHVLEKSEGAIKMALARALLSLKDHLSSYVSSPKNS